MLPAQRRYVFEDVVRDVSALLAQMGDSAAKIDGVPVNDGADDEVEAGGSKGLAVKRSVADFAAFVEEDSAFELMRCLAFVQCAFR